MSQKPKVSKQVSSDLYDEEYHQAHLFQVQIYGITLIQNKIKTNEQSCLLELKSSRNYMVVFLYYLKICCFCLKLFNVAFNYMFNN